MRSFLVKLSLFFLLLLGLLGLLAVAGKKLVSKTDYYKLDADKEYVFLGHSQPSCAYNDSLIAHAVNLADPMEGYFYTFIKLRKLLEANPQIRYVFVEFTNNQLTSFANNRIYGEYANALIPKYYSCMSLREMAVLLSKNPAAMLKNMPLMIKTNMEFLSGHNQSFIRFAGWGGHEALNEQMRQGEVDSLTAPSKGPVQNNYSISELNLQSLRKLVQFAKEKNAKLFFVRSPMLAARKPGNEGLLNDIASNDFKDVPFLDFKDFPLQAADFADLVHLNKSGARKFSLFFNGLLANGIIGAPDQQQRIHEQLVQLQRADSLAQL